MLKLFRRFKLEDWLLVIFLIAIVVGQVYFDLELVTKTQEIVAAITAPGSTWQSVLDIGLSMLLIALASVACTIVIGYIASHLSSKFAKNLRGDVFRKVGSFSFEKMEKFSTASLITRSTNDIQQVQMATMMILRMAISAPITAVWAILRINATSPQLTVVTAITVILLVSIIMIIFSIVMPRFKIVQKLTDKLNGVTRENLTGLRVVKAYNADSYQEGKFAKANNDVTRNNLFINRTLGLMNPVMMLIMNGITLVFYWYGAYLINDALLDLPTLTAFSGLVMQILISFMMLTMLFIMVPRAAVSANRINEVLSTKQTIQDPLIEESFKIDGGEIEFVNVSFRYPDAEDDVLKNISFKAKSGQTVAFIGSTGSGKSTLINLIPRFYDVTSGKILLNGVDVQNIKQKTLRGKIGYIPQRGILFSGTVASNISFGNENITDEKLEKAASIAMADEFVQKMEEKYTTHIAQGGKNISGGQKQRLSIARAIAKEPAVYIFDDSFSALDYKTDKEVRRRLKEHAVGATNLIVAQRIGTIMEADLIIVLDNGMIVGKGTHKELLEKCAVYKEIALSQLSEEELAI